ncbi:MAG TPA: hypothetical protein VHC22_27200 [Pirellulales bacterium]|nr:hypothetical protein [Pirellulales bacterium]
MWTLFRGGQAAGRPSVVPRHIALHRVSPITASSFLCAAAACCLLMAAQPAGAQQPRAQFNFQGEAADPKRWERTVRVLQEETSKQAKTAFEASKVGSAEEQQTQTNKLRALVEESFVARQNWQTAQLAELRRRLGEIEHAIEEREKNKNAIIQSRLDELASGPPAVHKDRQTFPDPRLWRRDPKRQRARSEADSTQGSDAIYDPDLDDTAPDVNNPQGTVERKRRRDAPESVEMYDRSVGPSSEEFDIDTREELARLDVEDAQGDFEAAKKGLAIAQARHNTATAPASVVVSAERDSARAEVQLKRAKAKLQGVARQRAELESAAEAGLVRAKAEESKAEGGVRTAAAAHEAARAEFDQVTAEVEATKATLARAEQQFNWLKKLAGQNKVDDSSLAEQEEKVATAKAAFDGAKASVVRAEAKVRECAAAIDIARAELYVAQVHLRAATAHRDRLATRHATDKDEPATAPTSNKDGDSQNENERRTP